MRDIYIKKVLYQSRYRGTAEADRIIGDYVKSACFSLTEKHLKTLLSLLELDDHHILSMVAGNRKIPSTYKQFIIAMRLRIHVSASHF